MRKKRKKLIQRNQCTKLCAELGEVVSSHVGYLQDNSPF